MRATLKNVINSLLARASLRVINNDWGPRGVLATLSVVRATGYIPDLILDIGAARGEWSEEIRSVFPNARYFMIDPLQQNRSHLDAAAAKIGNAAVFTVALGAETGRLVINTHADQSSFLRSHEFAGDIAVVDVMTCDDIIAGEIKSVLMPRLLIKIDVQGYELEVLKGAERTLESTDILIVEVSIQRIYEGNPLAHEVISYLGARGFCIYDIASYVQRPRDHALTQVDLVFVRDTSPLMSYIGWR